MKKSQQGISIVTACMNREDFLVQALPSWLQIEEVNEVVIVDWSSKKPVIESLDPLP